MQKANDDNVTYSLPDQYHNGLTMRGLFDLWLASHRHTVGAATYKTYERIILQHILPVLGDNEVDYLTMTDINDFLREKTKTGRLDERGGLSRKYVADISRIIRSALKLVNWDDSMAAGNHAFMRSQHDKRDNETLTDAQAQELVRYLVYYIDRSNAGFLVCLFTGMKLSEICALKDSDLDLDNNRLYVRRTLQRVTMQEAPKDELENKVTVEYGLADSEYRILDLPKELSMLLQTVLQDCKAEAYFLTGSTDTPIGPRTYQYRFQSVLSNCGLPQTINFYVLRNTFALLWLYQNGDIKGLSRALGHASVRVTLRRYSKLMEKDKLHLQNYMPLLVGFY